MKEAVIVAACRTAVGKAPKGILKNTRPEHLGVTVINELLKRAGDLDPQLIDDVIIGCSFPEAEQGGNLGRVLAMSAGLPDRVPGVTVNRFCASGLESIAIACQRVMSGQAEVLIAGGVESMSTIPLGGNMMYPNPALVERRPGSYAAMGLTAENVAQKWNISRERQDEFGAKSQQKAEAAIKGGKFKSQIVPVTVEHQVQGPDGRFTFKESVFDTDEGMRPGTTAQGLSKLRPAFDPKGSVTAGNSSQTSDGAAGVVVMSKEKAKELGLKPMATFRNYVAEGCEPEYMGIGPAVAIPKALKQAGMEQKQIDVFELNEAFAAQSLYVLDALKLNPEKVNPNGGAIALGHPLGCTGSKLTTQVIYELHERKARFGMVTMCIGFGMGAAGIFEVEDY